MKLASRPQNKIIEKEIMRLGPSMNLSSCGIVTLYFIKPPQRQTSHTCKEGPADQENRCGYCCGRRGGKKLGCVSKHLTVCRWSCRSAVRPFALPPMPLLQTLLLQLFDGGTFEETEENKKGK